MNCRFLFMMRPYCEIQRQYSATVQYKLIWITFCFRLLIILVLKHMLWMILFVILVFTDIITSCNVWKAYDSRKEKRIGKSRSLTKLLSRLHCATPHISLLQEMMTFVVLGLTAQQVLLKEENKSWSGDNSNLPWSRGWAKQGLSTGPKTLNI